MKGHRHWAAKIKELKNQSVWQKLNSYSLYGDNCFQLKIQEDTDQIKS